MIKPIAIYLPQYHTIPENDKAWGEGFTEWTNVRNAKPLFDSHYQPHEPHEDVGYYDLSKPEVLVRQATMAKDFGIYGFAFYHYWFNGKRLLEKPLDNMLKTGNPDFPFLYIWANENWSRRWDGSDNEVIQEQNYSFKDDLNHIQFLCKNVFCDKRYITIDDKPVFIVYRTELLPDIKETARIWRNESKKFGFKDIYLVRVEHFVSNINPESIGFDCSMEFGPDLRCLGNIKQHFLSKDCFGTQSDYVEVVANMLSKNPEYKTFRCAFPSWDNSARKKKEYFIITNTSIKLFSYFLKELVNYTKCNFQENEQYLFINAWNEWGEGVHLEPDVKNGYKYLEAIYNSLENKNIQIPYDYIEYIENERRRLKKDNIILKEVCNNLQKVSNKYNSKDYQVGRLIINPLRKFKYFLMKTLNLFS